MSALVKTLKISNIQQLIDLNQDSTNFKLKFHCESVKPNQKFQVVVINQSELDNSPNLKFRDAVGEIGGDLVVDKNIYQNYFLILKAENPCDVKITINKDEIQPRVPVENITKETYPAPNPKNNSFFTSRTFLWIVVGIVALVLIYFIFFTKEKTNSPTSQALIHTPTHTPIHTPIHTPQSIHTPIHRQIHTPQSIHTPIRTPQLTPHSIIHTPPVTKKRRKKRKKKKFSFNDFVL